MDASPTKPVVIPDARGNGYAPIEAAALIEEPKGDSDYLEHKVNEELIRIAAKEQALERWRAGKAEGLDSALVRRSPKDAAGMPRPSDLVDGILPALGRAEVFGPSTEGKTFVVLSLAAHIALGRDWFGRRVLGSREVVYLANEGTVGERLAALLRHLEVDDIPRLHIYTPHLDCQEGIGCAGVDLTNPESVRRFCAVLERHGVAHGPGAGTVVVVDTKAGAAPGNENSPEWAQAVNAGMAAVAGWAGGLCLTVHHTGWDNVERQRGASGGFAALDASIRVGGTSKGVIKVTKHKGTAERLALPFHWRQIGPSAVVVPGTGAESPEQEKVNRSLQVAHAVYEWVMDAASRGEDFTATDVANQVTESTPSVTRAPARKAIKELIEAGVFVLRDGTRQGARGQIVKVKWLRPADFVQKMFEDWINEQEGVTFIETPEI